LVITLAAMLMMVLRGGGELIVLIVAFLVLISVFRVAGVLRFRQIFLQVQENFLRSREVRRERRAFESIQQRFRATWTFEQWWRAVRRMARRMGFARITITHAVGSDGRVRTVNYANAAVDRAGAMMEIEIPAPPEAESPLRAIRIEVPVREPLETIGRRISLFGRLLDEHALPAELSPSNES